MGFHVGLRPADIATGSETVQDIFGSPHVLDGNFLQLILIDKHRGMTMDEIHKFAKDTSGKLKSPAPGTENAHEGQRFWLGRDRLFGEPLTKQTYSDARADSFQHRSRNGLISK